MNKEILEKIKQAGFINVDNKLNAIKLKWLKRDIKGYEVLISEIEEFTKKFDICPNIDLSKRIKAIKLNISEPSFCLCGKPCAFSPYSQILFSTTCYNRGCVKKSISEKHLKKGVEPVKRFKITRTKNLINNLNEFKEKYEQNNYNIIDISIIKEFITNKTDHDYNILINPYDLQKHYDILLSILKRTDYINICFNKSRYMKWGERFYHIMNDLTEVPKCCICEQNNVRFTNYIKGYINKSCKKCLHVFAGYNSRMNRIDIVKKIIEKDECELIINDIKKFGLSLAPLVIKCKECGNIFEKWMLNGKIATIHNLCKKCHPIPFNGGSVSNLELEILNFIKALGMYCINSNRTLISPLELDILIPAKKIAIEFNGNYWHTEDQGKDEKYHINKTNKCLEKGYRLIHIFEDEWVEKQHIVKSRIKNILGVTSRKIYARKCEVREISSSVKGEFLDKYHIQGNDKSQNKLGLFYKNRLVAVMTFGKRRFDKKDGYELMRYATVSNFNIVGGAGKLLSYFRKQHIGETIISYADKRWSTGNLYKKLGFTLLRETTSNYWYIKDHSSDRLSRHQFMKHKLKDILPVFDDQLSEVDNMSINKYYRIFDCGNYVFELK